MRVADLTAFVDASFFFEEIGLGKDEHGRRRVKAARQLSGGHEHRGAGEIVGGIDRTARAAS